MSIEYSKLPGSTYPFSTDESGNCTKISFAYKGEKDGVIAIRDDVFEASPSKSFDQYTDEEIDAMYDDAIDSDLKARVDLALADV